jgi:hypothetical protein
MWFERLLLLRDNLAANWESPFGMRILNNSITAQLCSSSIQQAGTCITGRFLYKEESLLSMERAQDQLLALCFSASDASAALMFRSIS